MDVVTLDTPLGSPCYRFATLQVSVLSAPDPRRG